MNTASAISSAFPIVFVCGSVVALTVISIIAKAASGGGRRKGRLPQRNGWSGSSAGSHYGGAEDPMQPLFMAQMLNEQHHHRHDSLNDSGPGHSPSHGHDSGGHHTHHHDPGWSSSPDSGSSGYSSCDSAGGGAFDSGVGSSFDSGSSSSDCGGGSSSD